MGNRNKVVAMLLAGGQGSRLKALTKNTAKPAVPFGGKYKIIDFALSNATNSDIKDIGVLTQYKHYQLNEHLGNGAAWDFDRNNGGLRILSPYYSEEGGRWYDGTANAIYENLYYLDRLNPDYVLILSADHIYKMNYSDLLRHHQEKGSVCTIAVMEVPWEEASRFGIMNADDNGRITEFEEKPANPKSNLASMGIYMFDWDCLRQALIEDYNNPDSSYDFGHDVIPKLLAEDKPMYVYRFGGYWKDVGTVKSYWEANLDLIDPNNTLNIYNNSWKIYTSSKNLPPHYISKKAVVKDVLINEACKVYGRCENCVLSDNVIIEEGAEVYNSVLLPNARVKKNAVVYNAVVAENIVIEEEKVIGEKGTKSVYLVSEDGISEE